MKFRFLILLPVFLFTGCASHDKPPPKKNSYAEMERKQEDEEDRRFFYSGWLNPNSTEPVAPTIAVPGWMEH